MLFRALVTAATVTLVAAGSCTRTYTVKSGDTCDKISASQNVSTYQLAVLNPGVNSGCTNLMPDQALCVGVQGQDCSPVHVVVSGDTCNAIAAMHGTNTTFLYQNNPQINPGCTNIYIGEVLCAANSVIVPPPGGNPVAPPPNATPAVPSNTLPTTTPPPPPPATTPPPASSPASQPPANPTQGDSGDDGDDDDEDLPYCDEL